MKPGKELLFCALGGSGEIGMNVNLYGADGKWLMVDLGMTFGGNEYPGTELVFADLEFIEERKQDLVGIVLTHAHEDHNHENSGALWKWVSAGLFVLLILSLLRRSAPPQTSSASPLPEHSK